MQRRKLGTAVIWMVCLLGLVAVVWSRPPMNGSRNASHPPLALAAEDPTNPVPQNPGMEALPPAAEPLAIDVPVSNLPAPHTPNRALPAMVLAREFSSSKVSLKFEGQKLWVTVTGRLGDEVESVEAEHRISADYHLTTDSMLYGIITSAEAHLSTEDPEVRKDGDEFAQKLFDQPFAIRYRLDEGTLTVKDFKMGIAGDAKATEDLKKAILGCYHTAPAPPASL